MPEVLNFQHKLIQEYCAAIFIAKQIRTDPTYLYRTFPTQQKIEKNIEVLVFTCGLLAGDSKVVTDHIGNILSKANVDEVNNGEGLINPSLMWLLERCHEEGKVLEINPYMCFYPHHGHLLSQCLLESKVVFIHGVDDHDPLEITRSSAKVMLSVPAFEVRESTKKKTLELVTAIVSSAIDLQSITYFRALDDICKLSNFPQLKCIDIWQSLSIQNVMDLIESIHNWKRPEIKKLSFQLPLLDPCDGPRLAPDLLRNLMEALRKCVCLQELNLIMGGPLCGSVASLMQDPPKALKKLFLVDSGLQDDDVRSIAAAIAQNKLNELEKLSISKNHEITDAVVTELIRTCVAARPDKPLKIHVDRLTPDQRLFFIQTKIIVNEHQPRELEGLI